MSKIFLAVTDKHRDNGIKFCVENRINLEIEAFAKPDILDGNLKDHIRIYKSVLSGFSEKISMHGPFHDLYPASADKKIREVCRGRFLQGCEIAEKLNIKIVILHFNYIPFIKIKDFRNRWTEWAVDFWRDLDEELGSSDITIAMENLWEPDPTLMTDVLEKIGSERYKVCFDTGHVSLFSKISLNEWVNELGDYLYYIHVHNNYGKWDEHLPLFKGKINYPDFFKNLKTRTNPFISMEFSGEHSDFVESLRMIKEYFE